MARPLGSGPIHIYLGFGPPVRSPVPAGLPAPVGPAGAVYFGTTRAGPDIDEQNDFYPVMNDLTGPKQSMDEGFAGREDTISLVMSSWFQGGDNVLENFLNPAANAALRGTNLLSDLGTLMLSEGRTIGMWLVKAAGAKAVNVAAALPVGRYYPTCIMVGPNKLVEGNKENLRVRVFRAKKDIWAINQNLLPLFREDNAAFAGLPAPFFG